MTCTVSVNVRRLITVEIEGDQTAGFGVGKELFSCCKERENDKNVGCVHDQLVPDEFLATVLRFAWGRLRSGIKYLGNHHECLCRRRSLRLNEECGKTALLSKSIRWQASEVLVQGAEKGLQLMVRANGKPLAILAEKLLT